MAGKARQNDIAIVMADTFQDVVKRARTSQMFLTSAYSEHLWKWTSACREYVQGRLDLMTDLELAAELSKMSEETR
jgi:hypothetical protein